ncbi:MAG TPA: ATP-binding protein, partial [Anaerolineaceae bacterium]|nr:ATP-binding protein [Anaerolineaceae bacterium]
SLDLRPAMLDDLGLLPALIWLFGRYTSQTGVKVNVQHSEIENRRFPTEYEITAYRVVQEGLTNVARYAGVNEVTVRLWSSNGFIGIQVEDNGAGFDPEAVFRGGNSRGLVGMRERATSLGGRLNIVSLPGHGTCLSVELPLSGFMERRRNAR